MYTKSEVCKAVSNLVQKP